MCNYDLLVSHQETKLFVADEQEVLHGASMSNTQRRVTSSIWIQTCRAKMIGSLINCIIISKHSDFLAAMKAPERREI